MALETGSPVVPSFTFHLDGSYTYWIPKGKLLSKLSRTIGFVPLFFVGRFGIPFGIPKPQRLHVVIGKPIIVPKEREVSAENVNKYHSLFLEEMISLYDRHKDTEGYGNRKLVII